MKLVVAIILCNSIGSHVYRGFALTERKLELFTAAFICYT